MNPAIQKIVTAVKVAVSNPFAQTKAIEQRLFPKIDVYVQVHLQALAIGAGGGLLIGGLLGHFL